MMDDAQLNFGLHDNFTRHFARTVRIFERRIEGTLRRFDLTRTSWFVLLAVAGEGKTNPTDIADFLGIERTATSTALRALETQGLIERHLGRDDRRTVEVGLTALGEAKFRSVFPAFRDAVNQFHGKLTKKEMVTLRALLKKLTENNSD